MLEKARRANDSVEEDTGAAFKIAMRDMAGTVAIISTELDGERHGMAATSVVSLSMDPPSVLFCVNRSASIHEPLTQRGLASINILSEQQAPLCKIFSGGEKGGDRFDHGDWITGPEGLPCLTDAMETLIVRAEQQFVYGTHGVFSGEILQVLPNGGIKPLVYLNGNFLKSS
ncbi:MAG: flavin reductase family protein [Aquisalimonadaceae bacterium]